MWKVVGVHTDGNSWLPRLTGKVFVDLALWMACFGLIVGAAFPPLVVALGVPAAHVLHVGFFAATIGAGLTVGAANYALARTVVGLRLRLVSGRMRHVAATIDRATYTSDWSACDIGDCSIPEDSDDELGDCAAAFNALLESLDTSRSVEDAVRSFGQLIASELDPTALCRRALPALLAHAEAEAGMLAVVDDGRPRVAAARHISSPERVLSSEACQLVVAGSDGERRSLPDGIVITGALVDFRPREVEVRPVRAGDRLVAVLVAGRSAPATATVSQRMDLLLTSLAVALDNATAHQHLRQAAATDPLTGTLNRRVGLQRLDEEWDRATRTGQPVGLLLLDVDRFKDVNDTAGHLVGDQVLRAVAATARRVLRGHDVLMRYGGDEFVAVLPGAAAEEVAAVGRRVHDAIREVEIGDGAGVRPTVSVGCATGPAPGVAAARDLLGAADGAMYAAKAACEGVATSRTPKLGNAS